MILATVSLWQWIQTEVAEVVLLRRPKKGLKTITGGAVHRIHQAKAFLDAALPHELFDGPRDIDVTAPVGNLEEQVIG